MRPAGEYVAVRLIPEGTTRGGIIIPETTADAWQRAEVVAVGPGRVSEMGHRIVLDFRPGELVAFHTKHVMELVFNGEKLHVLHQQHIVAVLAEVQQGKDAEMAEAIGGLTRKDLEAAAP